MTRLIDADALIDTLYDHDFASYIDKGEVSTVINDEPTVEAQPVRHGKWDYVTVVDEGFWRCSNCGTPSEASGAKVLYKYCPFCGAKMDADDETDRDKKVQKGTKRYK